MNILLVRNDEIYIYMIHICVCNYDTYMIDKYITIKLRLANIVYR